MTAQFSECLRLDGRDRALLSLPLEAYFSRTGQRPKFPDGGTALWRGYVGQWEVIADRLYLVGLHGLNHTTFTVEALFPGFPDRVFAHWYSGELRVAMGARLRYVHQGFQTRYARELFLDLRRGVVVGQRQIEPDLRPSAEEQKRWQ